MILLLLDLNLMNCSFAGKAKRGSAAAGDALTAQNRLQGALQSQQNSDMVFLSPLDHVNVTAVLDDLSTVDPNIPLNLDDMPKMPKAE